MPSLRLPLVVSYILAFLAPGDDARRLGVREQIASTDSDATESTEQAHANASAITKSGDTKYCFCKLAQNAKACQVDKHGKEISQLRFFQASKRMCCKWSERGGLFKKGPGRMYTENDEEMCRVLEPNSCCHTPNGFSFYISKLSYMPSRGVYASLSDALGATNQGQFVPKYLLYKFVYDQVGEMLDCQAITPHAKTCELGVDADTFQVSKPEPQTCCHSEDYGVSFYISRLHRIKHWYDDDMFVARRDITGAYVNGQRFPAKAIQHYVSTLPGFWAEVKHHGPDWPYFCTEVQVSTSCELIANQGDSKRAGWHNFRIANPQKPWKRHDHSTPMCCEIGGQVKLSVLVRATFTVPFFSENEAAPKPFTDFEYVTGSNYMGKQVSAQQTREILGQRVNTARGGYYGLVCEKLTGAGTCTLMEAQRQL